MSVLPDSLKYVVGDGQIVLRGSSGFSPAAANNWQQGSPTAYDFSLASLANAAARQSAKITFPDDRPPEYMVVAILQWSVAPTLGSTVLFHFGPSPSATAANANAANLSGTDSAYTGYSGSTLTDSLPHLLFVGSFKCV